MHPWSMPANSSVHHHVAALAACIVIQQLWSVERVSTYWKWISPRLVAATASNLCKLTNSLAADTAAHHLTVVVVATSSGFLLTNTNTLPTLLYLSCQIQLILPLVSKKSNMKNHGSTSESGQTSKCSPVLSVFIIRDPQWSVYIRLSMIYLIDDQSWSCCCFSYRNNLQLYSSAHKFYKSVGGKILIPHSFVYWTISHQKKVGNMFMSVKE